MPPDSPQWHKNRRSPPLHAGSCSEDSTHHLRPANPISLSTFLLSAILRRTIQKGLFSGHLHTLPLHSLSCQGTLIDICLAITMFLFLQYQPILYTILLVRATGRIERGSFTLTLSQNRAWKSPLTRLFTLNSLCIDITQMVLLLSSYPPLCLRVV